MTGAAGAVVSRVKSASAVADSLPASSVCTAITVCVPSLSSVPTGIDHDPSGPTGTVPKTDPSRVTSTSAPGSPVPVMTGVGSEIDEPSAGAVMAGAAGAAVSTSKSDCAGWDSLPAASVWTAVTV